MVHCAVLHALRFVDLLEAELFVEADGGVEFGVRLDVERFIARVSGGLLDGFGQTSADALALDRVGEVDFCSSAQRSKTAVSAKPQPPSTVPFSPTATK